MSTHFLVKNKDESYWEVVEQDDYRNSKSLYGKPLEIVSADEEVRAIRHIAGQMNLSDASERFWKYNAGKKVESGGRIAYALLLLEE